MNEIILAIQELLRDSIQRTESPLSDVKNVFYGDPILINSSSLPAIAIQPTSSEYVQRGSRVDEKRHTIEIRLIYNLKNYLGDTDTQKLSAIEDSIQKIEKSVDYSTSNHTICGVIEKNSSLPHQGNNTCQIARVRTVNYTFGEARGFPSYEVVVVIEAVVVGDR